MHESGVKVLEEVHVAGVKTRVVIEVVCGGQRERNIRQIHVFFLFFLRQTFKYINIQIREVCVLVFSVEVKDDFIIKGQCCRTGLAQLFLST